MLENITLGFFTAIQPEYLLYCFFGVLLGNLIGVLPGIGALAAISMLLPVTYTLDSTGALMMLAGLYYGTSFGGATTSILLNLPGTATHAVVCIEGNPMARQGRGGSALFIAMFASFLGVCTGIILMMFFGPFMANAAFLFGPREYFTLMLLGVLAASTLTSGSALKGIGSVMIGLLLGVVGTDINSGVPRFTFGIPEFEDGLSLVALAMGLFGIADVLKNAGSLKNGSLIADGGFSRRSVRPAKGELRQSAPAISRGAVVGSFLGILPGAGGTIASFLSYALERKVSRTPEKFGNGAIEGVAGPESANSSAAITAFIPTLALGIPGDAVMALMLGALMIQGIPPGPQLLTDYPSLFWGVLISFWFGNFFLMVLNIPLIGLWVRLLSVPYRFIFPSVLVLICIGVYSANNSLFDVGVVTAFGIFGFVLNRLGFEPAPLLLGFVLGPMMEENFRRALLLSRGEMSTFFGSTISSVSVITCLALLTLAIYKTARASLRGSKA